MRGSIISGKIILDVSDVIKKRVKHFNTRAQIFCLNLDDASSILNYKNKYERRNLS
jgi:hypothetical protein